MTSHIPSKNVDLYVDGGAWISIIAIFILLFWQGVVARVIAGGRFAIPRVAASLRIEMRLLSETRSVLEYLPTLSGHIHGCGAVR